MNSMVPLIVRLSRNGFVESFHNVSAVVLDPSGQRYFAAGSHAVPVLCRSALKPLQLAAMLRHGLDLPTELLAVAAASHSGLPIHVELVRALLERYRLPEENLRCAPAPALSDELCRTNGSYLPILSSCSGKHAAMLATSALNGWTLDDYLDPRHPVQAAILQGIEAACLEQNAASATDGCGAPTYAFTLYGLARAYARLAVAGTGAYPLVARAIRERPEIVGGPGRYVTDAMTEIPGLIAKDGAEGLCAAATTDGSALAFKIHDGAYRAAGPVLAHLLGRLGYAVERAGGLDVANHGGGRRVGGLVVSSLAAAKI